MRSTRRRSSRCSSAAGGERFRARGDELDREREAVDAAGDLGHGLVGLEVGLDRQRPLVQEDDCVSLADLPESARTYVERVERALGVPVELVGTGAAREQVLART